MKPCRVFIVLILMAAMLVSCGPAVESKAPETTQTAPWEYDAVTKTLYVNDDSAMAAYTPDKENEEGTTTNTPWAEYLPEIEVVVVGDNVTFIGDYAFAFMPVLRKVTVGTGVTALGWRCFYRCGDWGRQSEIRMTFNCAALPSFGEDTFGYTWDNSDASIIVPEDQKEGWYQIFRNQPMYIENFDANLGENNQPEQDSGSSNGEPQWSIKVNDYEGTYHDFVDAVAPEGVEIGGETYKGLQVKKIVTFVAENFDQSNGNTVEVIFGKEGAESLEITALEDAYLVFMHNHDYLDGPYLVYNGELMEYPIIEFRVY